MKYVLQNTDLAVGFYAVFAAESFVNVLSLDVHFVWFFDVVLSVLWNGCDP